MRRTHIHTHIGKRACRWPSRHTHMCMAGAPSHLLPRHRARLICCVCYLLSLPSQAPSASHTLCVLPAPTSFPDTERVSSAVCVTCSHFLLRHRARLVRCVCYPLSPPSLTTSAPHLLGHRHQMHLCPQHLPRLHHHEQSPGQPPPAQRHPSGTRTNICMSIQRVRCSGKNTLCELKSNRGARLLQQLSRAPRATRRHQIKLDVSVDQDLHQHCSRRIQAHAHMPACLPFSLLQACTCTCAAHTNNTHTQSQQLMHPAHPCAPCNSC